MKSKSRTRPHPLRLGPPPGIWAVALLALLPRCAEACSVPVFRYALERWPADAYELVLPNDAENRWADATSRRLIEAIRDGTAIANVRLSPDGAGVKGSARVSRAVAGVPPDTLGFAPASPIHDAGNLELRYPPTTGIVQPAWRSSASEQEFLQLLDSPLRAEIGRRLLSGDCAVWVLLESGNRPADERAAALLESRLQRLESELEIQTLDPTDIAAGLVSVAESELKVKFSMVCLSRADESERALVSMLLGTEPDLRDFDAPIAIPVYGRGRALYALVGDGISARTIDRACAFLVGPCSCQAKELNPGVDLLMAVDWDAGIERSIIASRELPPLTGLASFSEPPETPGDGLESGVGSPGIPREAVAFEPSEDRLAKGASETIQELQGSTLVQASGEPGLAGGLLPTLAGLGVVALLGLGAGTWLLWRRHD